ncbi:MAG: hypothetical protein AAGF83_19025 [Cyanobacteria bacterium P01_G01_bin.67]
MKNFIHVLAKDIREYCIGDHYETYNFKNVSEFLGLLGILEILPKIFVAIKKEVLTSLFHIMGRAGFEPA